MRGSEWTIKATTAYRVVPDLPTDPPEINYPICDACYWFEPCPCGRCDWGVCRIDNDKFRGEYISKDNGCKRWKEA